MANDKHNALAKLSEFLKGESELGSDSFKEKVVERFGDAAWSRHIARKRKYDMASRIIAELAKVHIADGMARRAVPRANCLEYSFGNEPPKTVGIFTTEHFPKWFCSAVNAVEKCRAIAEEGIK